MKQFSITVLILVMGLTSLALIQDTASTNDNQWISLFNGKNLEGWKAGVNSETFSVEDGAIKVHGLRSHLFYVGDVENHSFKNFEFKASVMTKPGANSGIYIHTRFQEDGWPKYGYEVQVNNTQQDWRRTGSLYGIQDVIETYAVDDEWYTEYVKVEGKRIIIKINDIVVIDYTEPENPKREGDGVYRVLSEGTFALQGHDPESVVFYKDIMVRPLP
ncbi:MAG: glycosyl hydrolase [Cyclobacteriaceae bacterium]|nr:MAG: glycosyl hydrolase [Cyclobacteriaceae bacterium]